MDGWMDGWKHGRMEGGGQIDRRTDGRMVTEMGVWGMRGKRERGKQEKNIGEASVRFPVSALILM